MSTENGDGYRKITISFQGLQVTPDSDYGDSESTLWNFALKGNGGELAGYYDASLPVNNLEQLHRALPDITDEEVQYFRAHVIQFIRKRFQLRLHEALDRLEGEAMRDVEVLLTGGSRSPLLDAMLRDRVAAEKKKLNAPLPKRPKKEHESLTEKLKREEEAATFRQKAIEAIRALPAKGKRPENKAALARELSLGSEKNRTKSLDNKLRLYGLDHDELLRDAGFK